MVNLEAPHFPTAAPQGATHRTFHPPFTPEGCPKITRTLIDKRHSNSFTAWQTLGSPQSPTADQIRLMKLASQLASAQDKTEMKVADGHCEITFTLARQGVTLVELEWP